jgi:RNA polymerase sigma factor (sigma-70 family)
MTWEECVTQYEPLCHRFAKQYSGLHTTTYDERVNLALYGLWMAFESYDETKGASFLSYAFTQIKSRFSSELKKSKRIKNNYLFLDNEFEDGISFIDTMESTSCDELFINNINELVDEFCSLSKYGNFFRDKIEGLNTVELSKKYGMSQPHASRVSKRLTNEFKEFLDNKKYLTL